MFRDCHSNKRWLSGWQWHLHAATRARAGHNTTVCPNGEVRAQGAGGGGSNSAFVSPLLRAGVTHHRKQGKMTKISWTDQWGKEKWKQKNKKIKPLCLLVRLSSGRWICVLGRKLTSPTNICYILHVSWYLYLGAWAYLPLGAFLVTLSGEQAALQTTWTGKNRGNVITVISWYLYQVTQDSLSEVVSELEGSSGKLYEGLGFTWGASGGCG